VQDNGIGIEPAQLEQVFEPFAQLQQRGEVAGAGGIGIGLTLARALVELHGGRMRIRSTLGKGTLVAVRLPLMPQCPLPKEEAA
jgi:signal transduction histidine kinase